MTITWSCMSWQIKSREACRITRSLCSVLLLQCKDHLTISYCNAEAHIPLTKWPKKWNLSIPEYPIGWRVLFMQLAQDFMIAWEQWACFYPMGNGVQQAHNTTDQSSALGFYPGLNHSDQATSFLYSSCSSPMHDGAGPVAGRGRPVLLLPMPHAPMPLAGFPADMIQRHAGTGTGTKPHSETCINKSKRVLLACSCYRYDSDLVQWMHGHVSLNTD